MRHPIPHRLLILFLAIAPALPVIADNNTETLVRLNVSPAPIPDPAMKYTFIPQKADQIPGNAAPIYLNSTEFIPQKTTVTGKEKDTDDLLDEIQSTPISQIKVDELSTIFNEPAFDFLWQASLRDRAGWSNTVRQQGFEALLPSLHHMRLLGNYIIAHGRIRLAANDIPGAFRDARINLTLAHHLAEDAVLVQGLVGDGIADAALSKIVEDLITSPNSPNLYWAFSDLPKPMFSMADAMAWEKVAIRASLTPLRTGRTPEQLSPAEWDQVAHDFSRLLLAIPTNASGAGTQDDGLRTTALAIIYFPKAKQQLISHGLSQAAVNAMPVPQVLGMAMLQTHDHWIDEQSKWSGLPYWQAAPGIAKTTRDIEAARNQDPTNPAYAVIPSISRAYANFARLDRHIAILQTIEAIRAYASTHSAQLPPSLDQITDTPAPLDPTTGHPFTYKTTSDTTFELTSPQMPDQSKSTSIHYIITLRK